MSEGWTELVGFDHSGKPRIKIELPATEDLEAWDDWIMRWVRTQDKSLHLMG